MKKLRIVICLPLLLLPIQTANASAITGTKCATVGKTQIVKKITYKCVFSKGKKIWGPGIDIAAQNAAIAAAAAAEAATQAAAQAQREKDAEALRVENLLKSTQPNFVRSDVSKTPGHIKINWNGLNAQGQAMGEFDHVGIFAKDSNGKFSDGTKELGKFVAAGTTILEVPAGDYTLRLVAILKDGNPGRASQEVLVEQVQAEIKIELPTLPTGFTVSSVAFGVTADWAGTYATTSFVGFSRIRIYISMYDLGQSNTDSNNFTNRLVGMMTVNDTRNRITIGNSVIRGALGLTGAEIYDHSYFFYQVTENLNGQLYSVDGKTTWTRINAAGVMPN